jgi:hypothetical protein
MMQRDRQQAMQDSVVKSAYHAPAVSALLKKTSFLHKGKKIVSKRKTISKSRIHELTISLRFLGIILRVFRLKVSMYNVYCTL